ncbi:hypothetical protein ACFVW8_05295 [Streptomyces sp. NPDC058221]|uniref:hypothetical protein n=1 Tax=Streptomyces sp. NPDC058221 TaxID=3346388 RepID=UPI0036EA7DD6
MTTRTLYRAGPSGALAAWQITVWVVTGAALSGVGFVASLAAHDVGNALVVTAAGVPPAFVLGALCAWWLQRRSTPAADTRDIGPVPVDDSPLPRVRVRPPGTGRVDRHAHRAAAGHRARSRVGPGAGIGAPGHVRTRSWVRPGARAGRGYEAVPG